MDIYIDSNNFNKQKIKLSDNTYLVYQIMGNNSGQGELIILKTNNPIFAKFTETGNVIQFKLGNDTYNIKNYNLIFF